MWTRRKVIRSWRSLSDTSPTNFVFKTKNVEKPPLLRTAFRHLQTLVPQWFERVSGHLTTRCDSFRRDSTAGTDRIFAPLVIPFGYLKGKGGSTMKIRKQEGWKEILDDFLDFLTRHTWIGIKKSVSIIDTLFFYRLLALSYAMRYDKNALFGAIMDSRGN